MTERPVTEEDARRAVADAVPDERVVSAGRVEDGTNTLYRVETHDEVTGRPRRTRRRP